MEFLFCWIRLKQPRELTPELHAVLKRALASLPPAGPLRREVCRILEGHPFSGERIQQWPEIYRNLREDQDLLLEQLYQQASTMPRRVWDNPRLRRFQRCRKNEVALDRIQAEVEASWDLYSKRLVLESEVTAESKACHRVLVEGLAAWMEAIQLARADRDAPEAVERAAQGNRLLLSVQLFSQASPG